MCALGVDQCVNYHDQDELIHDATCPEPLDRLLDIFRDEENQEQTFSYVEDNLLQELVTEIDELIDQLGEDFKVKEL